MPRTNYDWLGRIIMTIGGASLTVAFFRYFSEDLPIMPMIFIAIALIFIGERLHHYK